MNPSRKLALCSVLFGLSIVAGCGGGSDSPATSIGSAAPAPSTAVAPAPEPPPDLGPLPEPIVVVAPAPGTNPPAAPPPPPAAPAPPPRPTLGNIDGVVISASSGQVIQSAALRAGTATATTNVDGRYRLADIVPGSRIPVVFRFNGYADGLSVSSVSTATTATLLVRLLPIGISTTFANPAGADIVLPGTVNRVVFSPATFDSAVAAVTTDITAVSPALDAGVLPGDYTTNNGTQLIESFGGIIITPRDSAGVDLNFLAGKTATLRISASTRSTLDTTATLFSLDTAVGSWVAQGVATLVGTGTTAYYEGSATRAGAWTVGKVVETVKVSGCVQNGSGQRATAVNVVSEGIDYSSTSTALTNAQGNFSLLIKKGGRAIVSSSSAGRLFSNSAVAGPQTADITLASCLLLPGTVSAVKIKLTWGASPLDVDSYLYTPLGVRINYQNRGGLGTPPNANLDVDDTTSFGPEVVTIDKLSVGTYTYGLDNFSRTRTPGMTGSPVRVELNIGGRIQVFNPPAGETSSTNYLRLFTLTVDSRCGVTVTTVNSWESEAPSAPATTTSAPFCSAN
jgi:hypothetical protein